ncbi:MAG: 50S ribosomal protein L11 methyltransferase [Dehalococcoidia bacterium]|nr:MAG: 50S ribosomal protein L11 methyltransferase [Dehalococcoidia bacterium]
MTPRRTTASGTSSWVEVILRCDAADAEMVADSLRIAGAEGVAIEPAILLDDDADFTYTERLDVPWTVRGTVPAPFETAARRALRRHLAALTLQGPLGRMRVIDVRPEQWSEAWKRFFGVLHLGERTVIRPTWERYRAKPHEVVIDLDPGTAFGTGQHETTRLCLEALEGVVAPGCTVLDVGAGSGILAIAAAKHGARRVRAIDLDASTVAVVKENAERNGVAQKITAAAGTLGEAWPWPRTSQAKCAEVVVANISSIAVRAMLPAIVEAVKPGGAAVLSGFLAVDAGTIVRAARRAGLHDVTRHDGVEWSCVVGRRAK